MLVFDVLDNYVLKVYRAKDLCELGFIHKGLFYGHQGNKNMSGSSSSDLRQIANKLDDLNKV